MTVLSSTDILSLRSAIRDLIIVLGKGRLTQLTEAINRLSIVISEGSKERKTNSEMEEVITLLTSIEMMLKLMSERLPEQKNQSANSFREYQK